MTTRPKDETEQDPMQRDFDPDPSELPRDVRGEPVATPHGTVTPAQQAVGAPNEVGGGEFPDPRSTPALFDPDADPANRDDPQVDPDLTPGREARNRDA